jgi:DNA-binding NarL/FixJ family response regulator
VVEDDPRFREIATHLLELAGYRVECAPDAASARDRAQREAFEVCVVDLGLPDDDGVELVRWLLKRAPSVPVLVLTAARAKATVVEAVRVGASGYILKEDMVARLAPAVAEVMAGGCALSAEAASAVVEALRGGGPYLAPPLLVESLTPREREVLGVLARGLSYEQTALVLDVSLNTIRTHVRAIYSKLGAASRTEALMLASRLGLASGP